MSKLKDPDYKNRWQTAEGKLLAQETWKRLAKNASLHGLELGEYRNRVDLRGIAAPEVSKEELPPFHRWPLHRLSGYQELRNVHLEGLDFSDSSLEHLHFFYSEISDCRFEEANCKNWRVRASSVTRTTFARSDLRHAALGSWYEGRGNMYQLVDFSRADMRGVLPSTATYTDCDFSYARLDKVEFDSSGFIRCRFAGELREVIFYDRGFKRTELNPMEDVDFSKAQLRWVEFRRLNLDRVALPEDDEHLKVRNYRCVLQKALNSAVGESPEARRVTVLLRHRLKWIGPQQEIGIFNRLDLRENGGATLEEYAVRILLQAEVDCSRTQ